MLYKYEPHLHTSEASKCGKLDGASFARFYKSLGYTGIVVTDHFYHGNTAIPRELPWNEWVTEFTKGYENARREGERIGIDVFFGWEYTSPYDADFLIYGLSPDWLSDNPEQIKWNTVDYMTKVREAGGTVIHAHPFRRPKIMLIPSVTDGVEIINANAKAADNHRAEWYADSYGFPKIGGSDNHSGKREYLSGVYLPEKAGDCAEFARMINEGKAIVFADRYDAEGN